MDSSFEIRVFLSLPDANEAELCLIRIGDCYLNDRLPTGIESLKGFMKHVVHTETTATHLVLVAFVEGKYLLPVMSNMHKMVLAGLIMGTHMTMFANEKPVTVKSAVSCVNLKTHRSVFYCVTQSPGDTAEVLSSGKLIAPLVEYKTFERLEEGVFPQGKIELDKWKGPISELVEAMAVYMDQTPVTTH